MNYYQFLLIQIKNTSYIDTPLITVTPPFLQTNPIDVITILFIKKFLQNVVRHRINIFIPCPIFSFISLVSKKKIFFINDVKLLNLELKK